MKYNIDTAHGFEKYQSPCFNYVPLKLENVSLTGVFPDSWKCANVQLVPKKNNRQMISNYRLISLLPICGKILEKNRF